MSATAQRFHHEALLYEGIDGFMASTLPFVREGVARREPTLVAVDESKIALLKEALGEDARSVQFAEMRRLGRNPSCIIPAWRQFVIDNAGDAVPMRGVGEPIWPGRSAAELDECHRHESLLNVAFDDGPAWTLICPYDTAALPADVVEHARTTHPLVGADGHSHPSHAYCDPYADPLGGELPAPAAPVEEVEFRLADLRTVRDLVSAWARSAGLGEKRAADVVLAVSELAANSVRHGGGRGLVRSWREPGRFFCEVRDTGRIGDPLAGRGVPLEETAGGRGLWIVNQVCDLVQLRSGESGSVARLHLAL
ncbi:MAG TPA: sensor histidine kinase [Thermoleophilaceae bacterium]|jgi:anti-sigma regulatory factor (Ser/Thr protein kinase)